MLGLRFLGVLCVISLVTIGAFAAPAGVDPGQGQPIARRILALYDGASEKPADSRIHRWAEAPLNHLGYAVFFRDVRDPLPASPELDGYAAVLTWFAAPLDAPEPYLKWAGRLAREGLKFIILGETGGRFWSKDLAAINDLLAPMGIRHTGRFVDLAYDSTYARSPAPFEAELDPVPPPYPLLSIDGPDTEILTELMVPPREGGGRSPVAIISPNGGFIAAGFEMMVETRIDRVRWLINPFAFFNRILDAGAWPRPDVTTQSGRRLFFAYAEIGEEAPIARAAKERPLDVLLRRIVMPHPGVPITIGFDPQQFSARARADAAHRKSLLDLLAQPQVEGAIKPNFCRGPKRLIDPKKSCLPLSALEATGQDPAGEDAAKWDIEPAEFLSPDVAGAEESKRIGLIQLGYDAPWSEAAAKAASRQGLRAIELASHHLSAGFPSVANVAPLTRPAGATTIVALPGEVTPGAKIAMAALIEAEVTQEGGERPRRLAPLFWRFHSDWLDDPDLADRIEKQFRVMEEAEVKPVAVSDYVATVDDFALCEIMAVGPSLWRVSRLGSLHDFRFDNADGLAVDMSRSVGVLGARRLGRALYVSLDAARDDALIALKEASAPTPRAPALEESRWSVSNFERQDCGWSFSAEGFGAGEFAWYDVTPGLYELSARGKNGEVWNVAAEVGADRRLVFTTSMQPLGPAEFTIRCSGRSKAEAR